jgi:hypothetical protein
LTRLAAIIAIIFGIIFIFSGVSLLTVPTISSYMAWVAIIQILIGLMIIGAAAWAIHRQAGTARWRRE